MTRLEIIRDKLTKCPTCKGHGEWRESIVCGRGESWTCDYCNGYGYMNPLKKHIYIPLLFAFWRLQEKWCSIKYSFLKIKGKLYD
jgi:pyruvate-formate lyase-activating enzyme